MVSQPNVEIVMTALDGDVAKHVRNIVINGVAELQKTTPVDTGFARASWVPRIGAASTNQADPRVNTINQQAALQARQIASIAGYTTADRPIHISNNTQYIGILNSGSSTQAPSGFIEAAIERVVRQESRS